MKKKKPLLQKTDPPPFRVVNKNGKAPGVIVCDHAASRIPKALQKTFGVPPAHMKKHFALDPGAAAVARALAKKLAMPAVLAQYSRLVVDLNRAPSHPDLMTKTSDPFPENGAYKRIPIPGNRNLSKKDRQARMDALFWPYQKAIGALVKAKRAPAVISIHSFTPDMDGRPRPWQVGVLWKKDKALAQGLLRALRAKRLAVGDNEPYAMGDSRFRGSTLWRHGERPGLPHVLIEIRSDQIDTPGKAEKWAQILALALRPLVAHINR